MIKTLLLIVTIFYQISICALAQTDPLPNLNDNAANVQMLNDQLRQTQRKLLQLQGSINLAEASGILGAANGGTGQDSSNWSAGDVVYMSSTGVWGHAPLTSNVQMFITSGTFTAPTGVSAVYLTGCGGGAGGGGDAGAAGGGGSAGNYVVSKPYAVTPLSTYSVGIGTGGPGGDNTTNGTNGGATTFDTFSMAGGIAGVKGGSGGAGGVGSGSLNGSSGAPGGSTGTPGGNGGAGTGSSGGSGGGTILSQGAAAVHSGTYTGGSAAANSCGGGAGGSDDGGGTEGSGGNGGSGILILSY